MQRQEAGAEAAHAEVEVALRLGPQRCRQHQAGHHVGLRRLLKRTHQLAAPVGMDLHVVVGERDQLAGARREACVTRDAQSWPRLMHIAHPRVLRRYRLRAAAGRVVDHDDLAHRRALRRQRAQALRQIVGPVARADDDRELFGRGVGARADAVERSEVFERQQRLRIGLKHRAPIAGRHRHGAERRQARGELLRDQRRGDGDQAVPAQRQLFGREGLRAERQAAPPEHHEGRAVAGGDIVEARLQIGMHDAPHAIAAAAARCRHAAVRSRMRRMRSTERSYSPHRPCTPPRSSASAKRNAFR